MLIFSIVNNKEQKTYISYGKVCRKYRKKKGLTGRQAADIIGVTQPAISNIENGETMPSLRYIRKFIKVYEIEPFEIADFFSEALTDLDEFKITFDETGISKKDFLKKLAILLLNGGRAFPGPLDEEKRRYNEIRAKYDYAPI